MVEFDLPEGMEHPMIFGDGYSVACQKDGAKAMFVAENLPPKGYRTYRLCAVSYTHLQISRRKFGIKKALHPWSPPVVISASVSEIL